MYMTNEILKETKDWKLVKTGEHSSEFVWKDDGIFGNVQSTSESSKKYECPRGHKFTTTFCKTFSIILISLFVNMIVTLFVARYEC